MKIKSVFLPAVAIILLGTGCNQKVKPTDANYTETINAYFSEHNDCLLDGNTRFPFEVGEEDTKHSRQMESLVKAQMLDVKKEPAIHIARYTLTPAGIRAGKDFCFGHRIVTNIVSSTPPAPANGFTETNVRYEYKIADEPIWAKTPEVVMAFPKLAEETSGTAVATMTLALTGVGWSVPN